MDKNNANAFTEYNYRQVKPSPSHISAMKDIANSLDRDEH